MYPKDMTKIEVKAEIYRIIRNHQDKPKRTIMKMIKKNFPELHKVELCQILEDLL